MRVFQTVTQLTCHIGGLPHTGGGRGGGRGGREGGREGGRGGRERQREGGRGRKKEHSVTGDWQ